MKYTNLVNISLEEIHFFMAVAKNKSFTEAAEVLHITQPALSRKISTLEQEIGEKLFYRGKQRIELTSAGEQLYFEWGSLIEQVENSLERIKLAKKGYSSILNICCDEMIQPVEDYLFPAIREFKQRHPAISVELEAFEFAELRHRLRRGIANLVITGLLEIPTQDREIVWEDLATLPMCVGVNVNHPFAKRRMLKWSDLKDEIFLTIQPAVSDEYHSFIMEESKKNGFVPLIRSYSNKLSVLLNLGLGNGIHVGSVYGFGTGNKQIKTVILEDIYTHIVIGRSVDSDFKTKLLMDSLIENVKGNVRI